MRPMATGSYLTGEREVVTVSSCPRSFEEIIMGAAGPSSRLMSYGLYLKSVRELSVLMGVDRAELRAFIKLPWKRLNSTETARRQGVLPRFYGDVMDLGPTVVPRAVYNSVSPLTTSSTLDIAVIQMNVQDLISTPRHSSRITTYEVINPFLTRLVAQGTDGQTSLDLRVYRIKFREIQQCDVEMILRAKAAESPILSIEEVSSLLNPLVPIVTLRAHRTVNALVDWAIVQGTQQETIKSEQRDPSVSWKG